MSARPRRALVLAAVVPTAALALLGLLGIARGADGEAAMRQGRKFAAAIHTTAHGPWLGNRAPPGVVLTSSSGTEDGS